MTLDRPNARGSDCPSESPCPTTSPSPSPYSPTDFGHLHHLSHQRGASAIGAFGGTHPRDVMVSATRIDTDLTTIEHLDFGATLPCEHRQHQLRHADEPAAYLAEDWCPSCGANGRYLLCKSGWVDICKAGGSVCNECGHRSVPSEVSRIVEVLR